jgi:hypothetical protein
MLQAVICAPRDGVSLEQAIADIRKRDGIEGVHQPRGRF